jgi:hypothetical protein
MTNNSEETLEQRCARYLRLAAEARENAARTKDRETREAYLALADSWLSLAQDIAPDS